MSTAEYFQRWLAKRSFKNYLCYICVCIFIGFSLSLKWIYFLKCCVWALYWCFSLSRISSPLDSLENHRISKARKADFFSRKHSFHPVSQAVSELDFPTDHFLGVSPVVTEPLTFLVCTVPLPRFRVWFPGCHLSSARIGFIYKFNQVRSTWYLKGTWGKILDEWMKW